MNCPHCHHRIDPDFIYERWYRLDYQQGFMYLCPACKGLIHISVEYKPKFKLEK